MARQNGWFAKKDKTDIVDGDGFQQCALEYPELRKDEIFEAVDRFYRAYYLRPKPICASLRPCLRTRESLSAGAVRVMSSSTVCQRKADLAAARQHVLPTLPASA